MGIFQNHHSSKSAACILASEMTSLLEGTEFEGIRTPGAITVMIDSDDSVGNIGGGEDRDLTKAHR